VKFQLNFIYEHKIKTTVIIAWTFMICHLFRTYTFFSYEILQKFM